MAVYEENGRGTRSSEVKVRPWRLRCPAAIKITQEQKKNTNDMQFTI